MERKLVQMGKHCLMAAIPKKWIKHHNLQKGDSINFEEVEQYLLISPNPLPKDKSISITIKQANRIGIYRILQLLYDAGFKTIRINYDTPDTLTWLLWSVKAMEEWRLETINKNKCIIKTINIERDDFQNYFRRIFLITKSLSETYSEFLNGKKELIDEIRAKHLLIISGTQTIKRMINTSSLPLEYKYYYFIAIQLEEIADQYEYLLRALEKQGLEKVNKIPKELIQSQKKLCKLLEETYNNFYKFDIDWFIDLSKRDIWQSFATENNPLLTYHLRAISERIKNIAKYTIGIRL
ncbi:MAG: hypothetical protein KKH88_04045 [Nanoarchaeota archaeon]|nr:hypothetical protein [Nanoarchaeota archaeon]MBU1445421.1 hypothetical protein [Nanoarchaeota archaeon]MBU2420901.1 hypothetical protein [Nanoarchaeota archaeon]MBU2475050.1 hypothetical protein [Nanoarchaeota archaeon]MBU3941071.1 hypothetical protein [Nanoarchaeota archaeon]